MSNSSPLRFTLAQILAHSQRTGLPLPDGFDAPPGAAMAAAGKAKASEADVHRGTVRQKRQMNKTETSYAALLEARKRRGEIRDYLWEGLTFLLPGDVRYKVDFVVRFPDDSIEMHEIKGGKIWPQDLVRYKVAAEVWGWLGEFQLWQSTKGKDWQRIR